MKHLFMMQPAFGPHVGIRDLLRDVCRWMDMIAFNCLLLFLFIDTYQLMYPVQYIGAILSKASRHSTWRAGEGHQNVGHWPCTVVWVSRDPRWRNLVAHRHIVTWLIRDMFLFLVDVYILWVFIMCLITHKYIDMMSAFPSRGSWGSIGDVYCWCFAMSKGNNGWHGTVHGLQHTVLVHICMMKLQ